MNRFAVIDANSAYWNETMGCFAYSVSQVVEADSPAEACAKARESGLDGLLFACKMPATRNRPLAKGSGGD